MTACVRGGSFPRVLRWGLSMAAVAALALGAASPSHAQTAAKAPAPKVAAPTAQKPAPESADKGLNTGIKVHGHWTIEVKNPDGTLVTHREFENSIAPGNGGGAQLLASVLSRAVTQGSWSVELQDAAQQYLGIVINEPNSSALAGCQLGLNLPGNTSESCSNNLSVTGPQVSGHVLEGVGTVTFMGSGIVPQTFATAVGFVSTATYFCTPSSSPTACVASSNLEGYELTSRLLDGNTPAGAAAGDPNPVPVTSGQTVQVTVTISFQ
jgi:hypothetical protein